MHNFPPNALICSPMNFFRVGLVAAILSLNPAQAQWFGSKKSKKTPAPKAVKAPNAIPSIAEKTKGLKHIPGIFDLYQDTQSGELFLKLKSEQLRKEYIHFTYTENGVIEAGHHRGSYRGSRIISFQRRFTQIDLIQHNTNYYFDPKNEVSKAAEANISESILATEKIAAQDSLGNVLLSADALFLSEKLHEVGSSSRGASKGFKLGKLTREKTFYQAIKNYPENVDFVVSYGFDNPAPTGGSESVADERYVNVLLQHSILEVPQNNFKPRREDYRIGYFTERINDMTASGYTNYKDVIHRWNLEKKNPELAKSEPLKPIVWWIENTTPKYLRPIIKHAALEWNKAFEPLGFINAVEVYEQPDTATWDAGDIRYNVLRWTSSPNPPFGGYGPSFVNPRTGEILGADIMFEYIFLTNRVRLTDVYEVPKGHENHEFCSAGSLLHEEWNKAQTWAQITQLDSGELTRLLEESLHYLVLHEMGHTLGLNHNMRASQLNSPEELLNPELTYDRGLIGSVMDYPAINLPPSKEIKVQYEQVKPGPYDLWAIDYGYSVGMEDAAAEAQRLKQITMRSIMPEHAFGNDADDMRAPGKAMDPRVNVGDLSNDAITHSVQQIALAESLMPGLLNRYGHDQFSYEPLRKSFSLLLGSYGKNAGIISRYIGGVYVERFMPGLTENKKPYQAVSAADQRRAMKALETHIFGPDAFKIPDGLVYYLQTERRGFDFFGRAELPSVYQTLLNTQKSVLDHLLDPTTLSRLNESYFVGNTYSQSEMLRSLTDAIFTADLNQLPNITRRNLQVAYTENLIEIWGAKRGYDGVTKSHIWYELKRINEWMELPTPKNVADGASLKAHRGHIKQLIDMALDD